VSDITVFLYTVFVCRRWTKRSEKVFTWYGDIDLEMYLLSNPPLVHVHIQCRRNFVCDRKFEQFFKRSNETIAEEDKLSSKKLRSASVPFDWKQHCFFCCKSCVIDERHPESKDNVRTVHTLELRDSVLQQCAKRTDAWSLEEQSKLLMCCDLVAAEAVYHTLCQEFFC
jgi:hypothetical protein